MVERKILFCQFSDYSWENSGNAGAAEGNINGLTNDSKAIYLLLSTRGQSEGQGWETKASNVILSVHQLKELGGSTLPVDRRSTLQPLERTTVHVFIPSFIHSLFGWAPAVQRAVLEFTWDTILGLSKLGADLFNIISLSAHIEMPAW